MDVARTDCEETWRVAYKKLEGYARKIWPKFGQGRSIDPVGFEFSQVLWGYRPRTESLFS